jgi:hypothetical protein
MKLRHFLCLLAFAGSVLPLYSQLADEDVRLFELPVKELDQLSVRPLSGAVSFVINNEEYVYSVPAEAEWQKILASSAILEDIQRATTAQIKSCSYGKYRKVTGLVLFYGNRVIPQELRIKVEHPKPSANTKKPSSSGKPAPSAKSSR